MHSTTYDRRRGGLSRLLWAAFWILLVVYVVRHPSEAAANARDLAAWLTAASESVVSFLQHAGGQ